MDGSRFDALTKQLAQSGSRRRFVGALAGGVGAVLGLGRAAAQAV